MGRDTRDRPRPGVPHGPAGAAHRARGPRGARPEPPSRQPRPRRGRVVGHRRARPRAAPRRSPWPGRRRVPGGGGSLAMVRPGHRRAQGPRGRPDRGHPRGQGTRGRRPPWPTIRTTSSSRRCAIGSVRSSSSCASSTGPSACVPQLEPRELERALSLLGRIPDATVLRLFDLLGGLPDEDVLDLVDAISRLSPAAARRATKLMSGVVRTVAR